MAYKVVDKSGTEIISDIVLHPGEILEDELNARGIKKQLFAQELGLSPSHLSDLLHEKRHINALLAIKLEQLLDIPAEYWMRVQAYYDLDCTRRTMAA